MIYKRKENTKLKRKKILIYN